MASLRGILSSFAAIQAIFRLGFIPEDDEFYELTSEQYEHFYATAADPEDSASRERMYMLLPKDPQRYEPFAGDEVFVLREKDVISLRDGERIIENYCRDSGKEFNSFDEKLRYCATVMPDVFSEGTKYECYRKGLKPV